MRAMTIITYICGACAALLLLSTFGASASAPQEAAGAAMALALVAIPYCVTATMQRAKMMADAIRPTVD